VEKEKLIISLKEEVKKISAERDSKIEEASKVKNIIKITSNQIYIVILIERKRVHKCEKSTSLC